MSRPAPVLASQRWRRYLPIAFVTYSFAYLDRSNYSIAAPGGLKHDLGMAPAMTGLAAGLFFVGYFFFQVPAARYAARNSVRNLLFWSLLAWGALSSAQGLVTSGWQLITDRLLLGAAEATVIPAMLVLLMNWFRQDERGRANTFLIWGNPVTVMWMSLVSGYLVQFIGWRWMFIIEGVPAIAWAFAFRALVTDRPASAGWLNEPEKQAIEDALREEETRRPALQGGYARALRSPAVVLLSLQYLLWNFGLYGFVFWLPTVIKAGTARGIGVTGALTAIPYAAAAIAMLVAARLSDRSAGSPRRRGWYIWPPLLVGGVSLYASSAVAASGFWVSFVLLIVAGAAMYAPQGPFFAAVPEALDRDAAGGAMGLINSFGGLGGFVGAYIVGALIGSAGTPAAFAFMTAAVLAAAVLAFVVGRLPRPAPEVPAQPAPAHSSAGPRARRGGVAT